jgi:hypothetical protein
MTALYSHLDDLLAVLRSSADMDPHGVLPPQLRDALARRLATDLPDLSLRVRRLDDWHMEALADFVAEAHILAEALDHWPKESAGDGETKVT